MKNLHPIAWWLWSIAVATALVRIHNSWLTLSVLALVTLFVWRFKSDGPWAASFVWSVKLASAVLIFRLFIAIVIGVPIPGHVLFKLPLIPLPYFMAGITLGGPVTWERVSSTAIESLNIVTIILIFGAATSLTNPRAVLRAIPPIFYEVGMVLVIATSLTPQLVENLKRIRVAQKIRGTQRNRFLGWRQIAMPLLEDSLARALDLAAAMDSRGYGVSRKRSKYRPQNWALKDFAFLLTGLLFLVASR